jgi:hypothetical protein
MVKRATQRIRYLRTPDGVQLAWAEAGAGPTLIKAANWMTHLEYEWESGLATLDTLLQRAFPLRASR